MTHLHGILAFLAEEILDVVRQPRLVIMLVFGPFLILLIFGLGFTGQQAPVRTIVVLPGEVNVPNELSQENWRFGSQFPLERVTTDERWARRQLRSGRVDLVVVVPANPKATIRSGEQIELEMLINAIDPIRRDYEQFVADSFVRTFNERVIERSVARGQARSEQLRVFSEDSSRSLGQVSAELEAGNREATGARLDRLIGEATTAVWALEQAEYLLLGLPAAVGGSASDKKLQQLHESRRQVLEARNDLRTLQREIDDADTDFATVASRIEDVRSTLENLNQSAELFRKIPPYVVAQPLTANVKNTATFEPTYVGFYGPAVVALLLQHIAVTLAALSLIRDRLHGTQEMFAVAPIGPTHVMVGKFLSHLLLTTAIGVTLSILMRHLLDIPFYGDPAQFIVLFVFVIGASLGWGFLISAVSQRQSQAVQLAMIMLLASVFFSGFFLNLSGLRQPVLLLSFSLPVTYGIAGFQRLMLAGGAVPLWYFGVLACMIVFLFGTTWVLYRRQFQLD